MTATKRLTMKQALFVENYLIDHNATQAAIRAGYSEKTAYSIGFENLKKPEIAKAIQEAANERMKRVKVDADYVLQGAKEMFIRCMQKEAVKEPDGCGGWQDSGVWKFDSSGAGKALKIMGDHCQVNAFKSVDNDGKPIDQHWEVTIVHSSKDEYDRSQREKCIEHHR